MSLLGQEGLVEMAQLCHNKSEYLKNELSGLDGVTIVNSEPTFNEFVIQTKFSSDEFLEKLSQLGFYAAINLSKLYDGFDNRVLISVTEKRTKEELDEFINAIGGVL